MHEGFDYIARITKSHIQLSQLYSSIVSKLEQRPVLERERLTLEFKQLFATMLQEEYFNLKENLFLADLPKETQVCLNGEWQNLTDFTASE